MRSVARRWVVDVGQAPMSSWPRISVSVGAASGSSTARAATRLIHGCRVTAPAQRAQTLFASRACSGPRRHGSRSASMRRPTTPSTAGRNVIAVSIATRTASAEAYPMAPSSGTRATSSASSAMITVMPANTTALPDVAMARATASRTSAPPCSSSRKRKTMNRA